MTPTIPAVATDVGNASSAHLTSLLIRHAVERDIFTCVAGDAAGCEVSTTNVAKVARAFHDDDTADRIDRSEAAHAVVTSAALDTCSRMNASLTLVSALRSSRTKPRRANGGGRVVVGKRSFKTRRGRTWARLWSVLHPGQPAVERFYRELSKRDDAVLTTACAYDVGAATLDATSIDGDVKRLMATCLKLGIPIDH